MPSNSMQDFLEGMDIKEGESITINCPRCKGIKKFSISNQDGMLLYNCYRASCDLKGSYTTNMLADTIKKKLQGESDSKPQETFVLPEYITDGNNSYVQRFRSRWDIKIELFYDAKTSRAVFPIYKNGRMIDAIGRALYDAHPKWYRYGGQGRQYTYCIKPCKSVAVVVEDCVSATVIGETLLGVTGVALLGTNLMQEHKEYLDTFDKVIVALDPDVIGKTIEYTKELKSYCDPSPVYALHIEDDLKYKREKDFDKLRRIING